MFDIGWSELALIAVVALIAIGPKELPSVLRTVGQWMGKARRMASEFQGQFQEAMREAEMADLKQSFDEVREVAKGLGGGGLMTSVTSALRIDDINKPAASNTDAATSDIFAPALPTTPEAPTAETFVEAEAHAAAGEPLTITPEVHTEPLPQDTTPAASEPAAPEPAVHEPAVSASPVPGPAAPEVPSSELSRDAKAS
jgi:sec-independent protein translocase protein TatB